MTAREPLPLLLPAPAARRLREHACAAWPREACGLLVQPGRDRRAGALRVEVCRNLAADPGHGYTIDPEVFLRIEHEARATGGAVTGVWHTHPHGDPRPSQRDRDEGWPGWSYLIVGVTRSVVTGLRAWRLDGERFVEQPVEIIRNT